MRRGGIGHAECHGAGARAVGGGEFGLETVGLGIDDEVDVALAMERDVLALVPRHCGKAHAGEQVAQQLRVGRCIFDEFETVGAHWILETQGSERARPG